MTDTKFKVGDRVRYVMKNEAALRERENCTGTIEAINTRLIVRVRWDESNSVGNHTTFYLELIPPEKTDQEIADEYREYKVKCNEAFKVLLERGYTISGNRVYKTETVEL